ncbi:sulfate ABC transporter permease subunit CysT [Radicibacter daui]|uniref:sulfate ABC transporter permease subunit CysT n=1 Tax=Radicibacter daui TaxID=3064829 RepID=UPI004046C190
MTDTTFEAAQKRGRHRRPRNVLPGFGPALGFTTAYLSLIVLIPLAVLFGWSLSGGVAAFIELATRERTLAALRLSFGGAAIAAGINMVFGLLVAWVLSRYSFPGRKLIDAMVDLPFALPTAVAGISLATLYGPKGWIGGFLADYGIKVAFTPLGVIVALTFVGLPFVVRTVQPVLEDLDRQYEEAAATLGAGRLQTVRHVLLPALFPSLLTGFAMALARGIGEYGSVIFIAGNLPMRSEIAPLLIVIKLEEFDYRGATVVAATMLILSFLMLLAVNLLQAWTRRHSA